MSKMRVLWVDLGDGWRTGSWFGAPGQILVKGLRRNCWLFSNIYWFSNARKPIVFVFSIQLETKEKSCFLESNRAASASKTAYLEEANVICVLLEATAAQVQSVFADDAVVVVAGTAETDRAAVSCQAWRLNDITGRLTSVSNQDRSFSDAICVCFRSPCWIMFSFRSKGEQMRLISRLSQTHTHMRVNQETLFLSII